MMCCGYGVNVKKIKLTFSHGKRFYYMNNT